MTSPTHDLIDRAAELFDRSRNILFITGAGISADSGLPTYRGVGGLYEDAVVDEGISIELALSGWMMERDPALTWKYIAQIEKACRGARFNRAHSVIAEMEAQDKRVWTLTQNVDGFHRDAGSNNVIEIHGNIHQLRCPTCGAGRTVADFSGLQIPPACLECEDVIRPDVVLFGEMLPFEKVRKLQAEQAHGFDLIVSIGTSSGFAYIAEPIYLAKATGIPTIEINPGTTEVSDVVELRLQSRAAMTLDAIWSRVQALRRHG